MDHKKTALVCLPSNTVDQGLRMKDRGRVDIPKLRAQHAAYCRALQELGFELATLPADDHYPDSVFVEDPAIIVKDTLVISRLRKQERSGEESRLEQLLGPKFPKMFRIADPGFVEGGDVLVTDNKLFIGLSTRTNMEGAEQLARIAHDTQKFRSYIFRIPESYLHLKGEVTFHRNFLTASEEIARHFLVAGQPLIVTPADERFGANCISWDKKIFIHSGKTKTKRILESRGLEAKELEMSEFEKIDGALTCLSKLFIAH